MTELLEVFRIWLSDPAVANRAGHLSYTFVALGMLLLAKKIFWGGLAGLSGGGGAAPGRLGHRDEFHLELGPTFLCIELYGFRSWWINRNIK